MSNSPTINLSTTTPHSFLLLLLFHTPAIYSKHIPALHQRKIKRNSAIQIRSRSEVRTEELRQVIKNASPHILSGDDMDLSTSHFHKKKLINSYMRKVPYLTTFLGNIIKKTLSSFRLENHVEKIGQCLYLSFKCYNHLKCHVLPQDRSICQFC